MALWGSAAAVEVTVRITAARATGCYPLIGLGLGYPSAGCTARMDSELTLAGGEAASQAAALRAVQRRSMVDVARLPARSKADGQPIFARALQTHTCT